MLHSDSAEANERVVLNLHSNSSV